MIRAITEYLKSHRGLRSLKLIVLLVIFFISLFVSSMMRSTFIKAYKEQAISDKRSNITRQLDVLSRHIIANNYKDVDSRSIVEDEIIELSELTLGRILVIDEAHSVIIDS